MIEISSYENEILTISISGKIYSYSGVPQHVFDGFCVAAENRMKFFVNYIKPVYKCEKIEAKWLVCGSAIDDIKLGQNVEYCEELGQVRLLKVKKI